MKKIDHFLYAALYFFLNLSLLTLGLMSILSAYGFHSYRQILISFLAVISGSAVIIGLFVWYREKTHQHNAPVELSPVAFILKKCVLFSALVGLLLAILSVR